MGARLQKQAGIGEHDSEEFEIKICLQLCVALHSGLFIQSKQEQEILNNKINRHFIFISAKTVSLNYRYPAVLR